MNIENIIIHEVRKEEQSVAELILRKEKNAIDDHAQDLSGQLENLFRKTGLNTGRFTTPENKDDPKPHFVSLLESNFNEDLFANFVDFSKAATKEFMRKLNESSTSKGGYLWFNHYKHSEQHFLSIVLLRKKNGLSLSSDLALDGVEQLDLDKLHMAARINISSWLSDSSDRYIAFRIGQGAKGVTEYFSKFIGCEEYTSAQADTQNLGEVIREYCTYHNFSRDKLEAVKCFVFEQCTSCLDNDKPVLLENISTLLDTSFTPDKNGRFLEISQDDPYYLNNEISIERSALKGLTRISGRSKKLSLSFDSDLLGVSIFYNSDTGEIRIQELPQELKAKLSKETS